VPVLENRDPGCTTVYEVNGLPSIELSYRYPGIADSTIRKIREAEHFCWQTADFVITPSNPMKKNLIGLGVAEEKISVISNGADITERVERPEGAPPRYIVYFGALQRWQGVDTLLRAMKRLSDFDDLWLVVCVSTHQRSAKPYRKLAEKLGVAGRILWFFGLNENELAPWRANALLSVAPLAECARNLDQGCCPLKILESMADGVPVVASDLPSTRGIITDRVDGVLVRPDRPSEFAMAIRVLLEYPDRLRSMGEAARRKVALNFTWDESLARLDSFYRP
jgi:glycosyltransferase involved in cell wall biosynthesis